MKDELLKVAKFGGSSLASAEQFKKVGAIIRADASRRYVVDSAPGKRSKDDTKVTDLLYRCYEEAAQGRILTGHSVRSAAALKRSSQDLGLI